MRVLITGTAGFIGFHTAIKFLNEGHEVLGIDSINEYYSVRLKKDRLEECGIRDIKDNILQSSTKYRNYSFVKTNIADNNSLSRVWLDFDPEIVINLAAQAGVRYSMKNAAAYVESNLVGFVNMIELARHNKVKHFVYASSSSVYGLNTNLPFTETDSVDHPASLYASSKRANELISHSYSNLYNLPSTGLRFFTVYGPWGRPDMFMFLIANAIKNNSELDVYMKNGKSLWRDFTFVQDIVDGVYAVSHDFPSSRATSKLSKPNTTTAPFSLYNIGNGQPIENIRIIEYIEKLMGKEVKKNFLEAPKTEPFKTWSNTDALQKAINYKSKTDYKSGVKQFIDWYKEYFDS